MSEEVVIFAIVEPAPGKLDRVSIPPLLGKNRLIRINLQLKEVLAEAVEWIKANEPGTLEFSIYEDTGDDGGKMALFEK